MGSISVELCNSNFCRLCSEDCQQNGIFIFNGDTENISHKINKYLPVKVADNGKLPRTICSNCHAQLLATISFFNVLSEGQRKLRILARTNEVLTNPNSGSSNESSLAPSTSSVPENLCRKRGRGRPRKENSLVTPTPSIVETHTPTEITPPPEEQELGKSRRRRKLPSRLSLTIQGKELEKVFEDEGIPDDSFKVNTSENPTVIGKVEAKTGEDLGDVLVSPTTEDTNRQQIKYRCETCNKVFTQEPKFLEHQARHDVERCSSPEEQLSPVNKPKKDQNVKKDSHPYECEVCSRKFKHLSSLSYHKDTAHNDGRRYVCNKCPRHFKHRQLLRKHQVVHSVSRQFICEECGASFKTKATLYAHELTHTGEKKHYCDLCGQLFAHKTSLCLHLRWHNGEKPFECEVCHKRFTQNGNLKEHMRIHTGEKPFACNLCNKRFTTSSQYKLHLKRHSGERPWSCNICGKSFLSKATWRCHMRRHKGEKPFDCKVCGRNFSELWALKKHMRTHTGEKPYKCTMCDMAFSDSSNLIKHKKSHLKAEPSEEEETEQVVYVSYTDPMNPSSEVSEKFIVENKTDQPISEEAMLMEVMDEMGNPLTFTLQDGTQLQVTTRDGRSLEVRTLEGHTIPVRLTTDSGEPISPELTPVVLPALDDSLVGISTIELLTTEEEGIAIYD